MRPITVHRASRDWEQARDRLDNFLAARERIRDTAIAQLPDLVKSMSRLRNANTEADDEDTVYPILNRRETNSDR